MTYNEKDFKSYDNAYFVSRDGDVYSVYKNGLLKHYIDKDGYHRVDIHGKHMKIHKLVYLTWVGDIPEGMQINHYDDNKDNNDYTNLYLGNQKQNIADCKKNNHRVGNVYTITVYDKQLDQIVSFASIKEFIKYTEHFVQNGSLSHMSNKKWFKDRFEVIKRESVTTIESYKSIRAELGGRIEDKALMHEASRVV